MYCSTEQAIFLLMSRAIFQLTVTVIYYIPKRSFVYMFAVQKKIAVCLVSLLTLAATWQAVSLEASHVPCRRRFLARLASVAPLVMLQSSSTSAVAKEEEKETRIYKMKSGVQFRNVRVGHGPFVTGDDNDRKKATVVLHVKALLRDGSTLLDTRQQQGGQPILYQLGSVFESPAAASIVTPGIDDALVSRGVTADTAERVEPMREGGVRLVVVPSQLAYGNTGVSRYQAWTAEGLQRAVPRDELIRYEIEVLRCLVVPVDVPSPDGDTIRRNVQACCSEDAYPCPTPISQPS